MKTRIKNIKRFIGRLLSATTFFLRIKTVVVKKLLGVRAKLQMSSLRKAIGQADEQKAKTGRKNMVVFNQHQGIYQPIAKKTLKAASKVGKNTSNKAMTDGRIKMMKRKKRVIDNERVKQIEKKSLYVTN